jgi:hypothetical protein
MLLVRANLTTRALNTTEPARALTVRSRLFFVTEAVADHARPHAAGRGIPVHLVPEVRWTPASTTRPIDAARTRPHRSKNLDWLPGGRQCYGLERAAPGDVLTNRMTTVRGPARI